MKALFKLVTWAVKSIMLIAILISGIGVSALFATLEFANTLKEVFSLGIDFMLDKETKADTINPTEE